LALAELVTSTLIVRLHHLAGHGVHELVPEPVAGLPVYLPKGIRSAIFIDDLSWLVLLAKCGNERCPRVWPINPV
jgi:hypothetical protein